MRGVLVVNLRLTKVGNKLYFSLLLNKAEKLIEMVT